MVRGAPRRRVAGHTINLVSPDAIEGLRAAVETEYPSRTGLTPMVLPVHAADGADRLR